MSDITDVSKRPGAGRDRRTVAGVNEKSALKSKGGIAQSVLGFCLACGPDHPLQMRELSRCGFRGEGHGAWCGSCRRVYALDIEGLEPAA